MDANLKRLGENSWEEFSIDVPWGTVEGESHQPDMVLSLRKSACDQTIHEYLT